MNRPFPNKQYKVIYADPPWQYKDKKLQDNNRDPIALNKYYKTMNTEEIKELPVKKLRDKDCACFLWVTDSHLDQGIEVLRAWGFRYVTIAFVWVKKNKDGSPYFNLAPWTLKSTEVCILGMHGHMRKYKIKNNVRSLTESERTIHSKKPDEIRTKIVELFGDVQKIELFAREQFEGWDAWGDQISNIE